MSRHDKDMQEGWHTIKSVLLTEMKTSANFNHCVACAVTEEKPWWYPKLCDSRYFARLRDDYPEHAHWSDDDLLEHYNDGRKYSVAWDHLGDAYPEYEELADAFLALVEKQKHD